MTFDIKGKVALITGGAQGIGFGCANKLLENGAKGIAIVDVNGKLGIKSLKELQIKFGENAVIFVQTDVTNKEKLKDAFEETVIKWGAIDIVINSAGIVKDVDWESTISINCGGVTSGTLLAFEYMGKENGGSGGVIVNLSSIAGIAVVPSLPIYSATKHYVVALSQSTGHPSNYDRSGIKVLAICPGPTETLILQHSDENTLTVVNKNMKELFKEQLADVTYQPIDDVANGIVELTRKAASGSVWIMMDGKPPAEIEVNTATPL